MLKRREGLLLLAGLVLVGCDKKETKSKKSDEDEEEDDDKPKKKKKKKKGEEEAAESATAKAPTEPPEVTLGRSAYSMGRNWGYACVFALLEKPDDVARNMGEITTAAAALGVAPPAAPTKDGAIDALRSTSLTDAIAKKHGPKIGAACDLGRDLGDLNFGIALGADVAPQLGRVATHATAAAVPDAVWKSLLDSTKASPTDATATALSKALDGHYQYKG